MICTGLGVIAWILHREGDYEDPFAWQLLIVAASLVVIVWLPTHFRGAYVVCAFDTCERR